MQVRSVLVEPRLSTETLAVEYHFDRLILIVH